MLPMLRLPLRPQARRLLLTLRVNGTDAASAAAFSSPFITLKSSSSVGICCHHHPKVDLAAPAEESAAMTAVVGAPIKHKYAKD